MEAELQCSIRPSYNVDKKNSDFAYLLVTTVCDFLHRFILNFFPYVPYCRSHK